MHYRSVKRCHDQKFLYGRWNGAHLVFRNPYRSVAFLGGVPSGPTPFVGACRSEEHTSELQSLRHLVCRLLLEKKKHHNKPAPPLSSSTTDPQHPALLPSR